MVAEKLPLLLSPVDGFPQTDKEETDYFLEQALFSHLNSSLTQNHQSLRASADHRLQGKRSGLLTGVKRGRRPASGDIELSVLLFHNIIPRVPEAKGLHILSNVFSSRGPQLKYYPA